jgi:nitrogen regulatory protein P-II 2
MKQITITVKPFRAEAVLQAVNELDVIACTVQEVKGYGRQKGYLEKYLGGEFSMAFLPKVEINVWVTDDQAENAVAHLQRAARTGRMGDGKIFLLDTSWPEPLEF